MPVADPPLSPAAFAALASVLLLAGFLLVLLRPRAVTRHPWLVLAAVGLVSAAAAAELVRFDPPGLRLCARPVHGAAAPRGDPARAIYERRSASSATTRSS